jgi:hypothetical protein
MLVRYFHEHYTANRETIARRRALCRATHKAEARERAQKYYRGNKEKCQTQNKQYQLSHKEEVAHNGRKHSLAKHYGITLEDYDRILIEQKGKCRMCGNPETRKWPSGRVQRLSVDHDHVSGVIRGLLCHICNLKLGIIEDTEFCQMAEKYKQDALTCLPLPGILHESEIGEHDGGPE